MRRSIPPWKLNPRQKLTKKRKPLQEVPQKYHEFSFVAIFFACPIWTTLTITLTLWKGQHYINTHIILPLGPT